ncbi:MAG: HAD family hydrolase [Candidatus Altiarchaeota archaeon]|nr:HAD family hydrolase [Candidatus Altiarchaeota archaeon]
MERVALFDIDYTLLKSHFGHRKAFSKGFLDVFKIKASKFASMGGRIDNQVIYEVMLENGVPEKQVRAKLKQCGEAIQNNFLKLVENGEVRVETLGGVQETLLALKKNEIRVGLLTGNMAAIGWKKLEMLNLRNFFEFGIFGDQGMTRPEIAKLAVEFVKGKFGILKKNIVVIGDTDNDIKAATEAGMKVIGVATGNFSKEDLKKAGADAVVSNLENASEILRLVKEL